MSQSARLDPDRLTELLRGDPMVHDAAVLAGAGQPRATAVIVPQGYQPGVAVRERVLELAGLAGGQPDGRGLEVMLVPAVPRDAVGQLDAAAVLDALAQPDTLVYRFEPPDTTIQRRLLELAGEVLPGLQISVTDSLPGLGADSIVVMALAGRIGEEFDLDVDPQDVFGAASLRELAVLLEAAAPQVPA